MWFQRPYPTNRGPGAGRSLPGNLRQKHGRNSWEIRDIEIGCRIEWKKAKDECCENLAIIGAEWNQNGVHGGPATSVTMACIQKTFEPSYAKVTPPVQSSFMLH